MKPSSQFLVATATPNTHGHGGSSPVAPDSPKKMYHDFALVPEDVSLSDPSQTIAAIHGTTGKFDKLSFPLKLHLMLERLEFEGLSNIVGWETAHGRCFKVYDLKRFVAEILPRFFRHSKYASFQRQLNLYGFERITYGLDKEAYYNDRFLRWRPKLASTIRRIKFKGTGPRRPANPQAEPNFYAMPPVLPPAQANQQQQQAAPEQGLSYNNKLIEELRNNGNVTSQPGLAMAPQPSAAAVLGAPANVSRFRSAGTFGAGGGGAFGASGGGGGGTGSSAVDLGGVTFTTQAVGGGFMQYLMVPMMNGQGMPNQGASSNYAKTMPPHLQPTTVSPTSFTSMSQQQQQQHDPTSQISRSCSGTSSSSHMQQLAGSSPSHFSDSRPSSSSSGNEYGGRHNQDEEGISDAAANAALQLLDDELLNSVCGGMNGNLGLDDFYFQQQQQQQQQTRY